MRRCVTQGKVSAFLGFSSQKAMCISTYLVRGRVKVRGRGRGRGRGRVRG